MIFDNQKRKTLLRVSLFWAAFWILLFTLRSIPIPIPIKYGNLLFGLIATLFTILLVRAFLKPDSKTFFDVGLAWEAQSLQRFLVGSVAGVVIVGFMLALIILFSGLEVEMRPDPNYWDAIGFSMLVLLALASMEEVAFRSYPLVRLADSFGLRTSIYVTSFFFALYHGLDPVLLLGPGVWGIYYGLAALVSRGIALPLGLHFGLNWMQSLFGMKTQFATSIWTIVPGSGEGVASSDVVGLILQVALLIVGVTLVELYIRRKDRSIGADSDTPTT